MENSRTDDEMNKFHNTLCKNTGKSKPALGVLDPCSCDDCKLILWNG